MKKISLLFLVCFCTAVQAQQNRASVKAMRVKAAMLKAMGGEETIKGVDYFNYSINRTAYNTDTTVTRTYFVLDLNNRFITETSYTPTDTIIKEIGAGSSWLTKAGVKMPLPIEDKQRLQRTFYTNFLPMLQNDTLVYKYKMRTKYKGRQVDVLQVYMPDKQTLIMDMFVDTKNGSILTSSRPDDKTGKYTYYADELDYQPIGKGVIFPLVYQIWVNESMVTEGKFENVVVE
ncbi:hypothetical protein ABID22_000663 [Pontibacter aydingkolensis]|uniref:Outer membrane lipoprotein-sorting protein n=1 Tax=Pontibacter aydingkolensis TaxID=1911536 RepID=A0ABS7CRP5_9BACT|nr:hypothetical protein [Pontibacter aydingkolensis]MBW7466463.1 hypothetical protein [Pontibacter aydingkolensis]